MEGRGTIFLGVIPFRDFGCDRAELGVMVVEHFFFPVEIYGFVTLFWPKDNGFYVETSLAH
jgi:hypothetical protein